MSTSAGMFPASHGVISGPFGHDAVEVKAKVAGMAMGHAVNPLVHRGDGLVHIAKTAPP